MDLLSTPKTKAGQPLASPLTIQQNLNLLRRQLAASDAAFLRLSQDREVLQAEILAETIRYQDALNAGGIAERGAAAVELAEEIILSIET